MQHGFEYNGQRCVLTQVSEHIYKIQHGKCLLSLSVRRTASFAGVSPTSGYQTVVMTDNGRNTDSVKIRV